MLVLNNAQQILEWTSAYRSAKLKIGFIPTMGALHKGHMSLVQQARKECEKVIVSIFVNPLQFGPSEDLNEYPRPFEKDRELCRKSGVDLLYHGETADFYSKDFNTKVRVEHLTENLCGRSRPAHFEGVCTVVTKLFLRTLPNVAFFGQKDYQQAVVIKQMVKDLDIPVKIKILPIVREADGLAISSRNVYLSKTERISAASLFKGLSAARKQWNKGERNTGLLRKSCRQIIESELNARIEYVEIADAETLTIFPDEKQINTKVVLAVAVRFSRARLIDNELLLP